MKFRKHASKLAKQHISMAFAMLYANEYSNCLKRKGHKAFQNQDLLPPIIVKTLKCTPDRRQSKTLILSMNLDEKSLETEFFYCHLSPNWQQMAIENTVSRDFWSVFVDC